MTEIWKPVAGFEGTYEVSSFGRVRKGDRILSQSKSTGGYLAVSLQAPDRTRKQYRVHRLVCRAFHGPEPIHLATGLLTYAMVAHSDGDRTNNRPSNLRWASAMENAADRTKHETGNFAEQHPNSKLTAAKVREIRARWANGEPIEHIAPSYGVCVATAQSVASRRSWRSVA